MTGIGRVCTWISAFCAMLFGMSLALNYEWLAGIIMAVAVVGLISQNWMSRDMENMIHAAAAESGRSFNDEVRRRLEWSFEADRLAEKRDAAQDLIGRK